MPRLRTTLVPLVLLLPMTGCSTGGDVAASPPAGSPSDTSTVTSAPATEAPTATAAATGPMVTAKTPLVQAFGQPATWSDGYTLVVDEPVPFKPSPSATGTKGYPHAVKITYTVRNESNGPIYPMVISEVTSGKRIGENIIDPDNHCQGSPYRQLLPGRRLVHTACVAVNDPQDVTVEAYHTDMAKKAFWRSDAASATATSTSGEEAAAPTTSAPAGAPAVVRPSAVGPQGWVTWPEKPDTQTVGYSETIVWPDGMSVTVAKPEPVTMDDFSREHNKRKETVRTTFTVKNGTKQPLDLGSLRIDGMSGDDETERYPGIGTPCDSNPELTLQPGKTLVFPYCFAVLDDQDVVVIVQPEGVDTPVGFWTAP